jgi:hypothetical protein
MRNHLTTPLLTEEYRLYWAAYDFFDEFPQGVMYKVGRDDLAKALNYVHWSVYGGKANDKRPEPVYDNVNNWTVLFDPKVHRLKNKKMATFTVSSIHMRQTYCNELKINRSNSPAQKQPQETQTSTTQANPTPTSPTP